MSDNVVPLQARKTVPDDQIVWVCGCGCMSFMLRADGEAECVHCEDIAPSLAEGSWRARMPEPPADPEQEASGSRSVIVMDETSSALDRILSHAQVDQSVAVIVIQRGGSVHAWRGDRFEGEQIEWLDRKLDTGRGIIVGERT